MRGRIEARVNDIIQLQIDVQDKTVELTGDPPDPGTMHMVNTIASSILEQDIEDTLEMLLVLQKMLHDEEMEALR